MEKFEKNLEKFGKNWKIWKTLKKIWKFEKKFGNKLMGYLYHIHPIFMAVKLYFYLLRWSINPWLVIWYNHLDSQNPHYKRIKAGVLILIKINGHQICYANYSFLLPFLYFLYLQFHIHIHYSVDGKKYTDEWKDDKKHINLYSEIFGLLSSELSNSFKIKEVLQIWYNKFKTSLLRKLGLSRSYLTFTKIKFQKIEKNWLISLFPWKLTWNGLNWQKEFRGRFFSTKKYLFQKLKEVPPPH